MINHNQNKVGFKITPLGWIPEDWEICKLECLTENFKSGEGITSSVITVESTSKHTASHDNN